jgi:predicted metal-dependent hydrolase
MAAETKRDAPLIVAFVADLMFTTRIANVANHLGYRIEWIERAGDVGQVDPDAPPERPGELLHGREGQLFQKLAAWQPALLLFDLTNEAIPWEPWITILRASPATRRIPILCFGPHEDVERMKRAKAVGATAVVARSQFTANMGQLFQKHARIPDYETLDAACREPLPDLARRGIEMFNQGEFYKCHDDLEEAWMAEEGRIRDLYRGILQVGIAYYQIQRGNYRGALKMLLRVRQWLDPLPPVCRGINIEKLRREATAVQEVLTQLGPEHIDQFDQRLFRPIEFTS